MNLVRDSPSNTTSEGPDHFRASRRVRWYVTWFVMAIAMIALMSADLVAERTLFRYHSGLFFFLYASAWNIAGALFITYCILHQHVLELQRVFDEVQERKAVEKSLLALQEELEQKVQERTLVLNQLNQKLETEIARREYAERIRAELIQQLLRVQEEERHHIARELHDQMGQHLAVLNLELETLKNSIEERFHSHILSLQARIKQIGLEVHDLSLRLRPPSLDDLGLYATLINHIEEWSERSRVKVDFQSVGLQASRLPAQMETTIFRIVQEALTNVVKHAQARQVSLVIRRDNQEVVVVVEDNGIGFDPDVELSVRSVGQRLGLLGIRERTELMGGRFAIESAHGGGTTLLIRLPIHAEETPSHA